MIARVWTAHAPSKQAPAYVSHVRRHVFPTLRTLDGYLGASLLTRSHRNDVEILVVTRWRSRAAIHGFAGEDVHGAVVAPEAKELFTRFDERVRHYEVVLQDEANQEGNT
jgi:heme-degrading monooxygenase HmoA